MSSSLRFLCFVSVLACIVSPILADDVQSGFDGDQIVPVDSQAIRMASEQVDVDVSWSKPDPTNKDLPEDSGSTNMLVKALFVLVNESDKPQSILVSFPCDFAVADFKRTVDGKPLKVEKPNAKRFGNISKIDFAPHQTRQVRIEYSGTSEITGGYNFEERWRYILTTGAKWKGTIGKAVVSIHFPKDMPVGGKGLFNFDAITMTPAGFETNGQTATWTFEDFEPTEEISLKWTRYSALLASDPFKLASKEQTSALLLEQGQQAELPKALGCFASIREFFPNSIEAKTLDYYIADALAREFHFGDINAMYAKEAIARYEIALKEPIDAQQRENALCEQFALCCVKARDNEKIKTLLDRIKKEELESKAIQTLKSCVWRSQGEVTACEVIREFFPDSAEAQIIDYEIARVYARHFDGSDMSKLDAGCEVMDPRKAAAHYEAALKQPLDPFRRQDALAELFILYSAEIPDPAKAQQAYERLKADKIDPRNNLIFLKVLAVSPAKSLALVDSISTAPEPANAVIALRSQVQRLTKAYPNGVVNAKRTSQTQPATRSASAPS